MKGKWRKEETLIFNWEGKKKSVII
jgi:hypothetical protein